MIMQAEPSVLIIEDHKDIAEMVISYLERREFTVDYAADGVTGLHLAVTNDYDVIVLDLMLPGIDGIELCYKFRNDARKDTPVIMLTARDTLDDKILGLETGADDYLIKPFAIKELEARIRSLVRRGRGQVSREILTVGELTVDTATMKVCRGDDELNITPIGYKILTVLMRASPAVVSRRELERQVWGDILPDSDTLRSHLYNLRKVVDRPFDKQLLHTIQGRGYKMVDIDGKE
jgi:DNA-binding response OmpR family regulator